MTISRIFLIPLCLFIICAYSAELSPQTRIFHETSDHSRSSTTSRSYTLLYRDGSVETTHSLSAIQSDIDDSLISSIHVDKFFEPQMDSALVAINSDSATTGVGVQRPYKGTGIIVGIIDQGFDYTHPSFRNSDSTTRIISVWDQNSSAGSSPHGYDYGTELTTEHDLFATQSDSGTGSHGTHVAGSAAGSVVEGVPFYGVAPDADLIFVSTTYATSGILDAVDYIFDQAAIANKPAVVNMSFASPYGPHDGTSIESRGLDQRSSKGILVGSASNSGSSRQHIEFNFKKNDILRTFSSMSWGTAGVDLWGEDGIPFTICLALVDSAYKIVHKLPPIHTTTELFDTTLHVPEGELRITAAGDDSSTLNGKSEIYYEIEVLRGNLPDLYNISLEITAEKGTVHGWNHMYRDFYHFDQPGYMMGDFSYTIGEGPGCSDSTIVVAAWTSKMDYPTFAHDTGSIVGDIAFFSSRGPTIAGKNKPDITAPGHQVAQCYSSFDEKIDSSHIVFTHPYNGRIYPYFHGSGTSMSSPIAAGMIALLLQVEPTLTRDQIMTIFDSTSVRDEYVTEPFRWGAGKIDVTAAIRFTERVFTGVTTVESSLNSPISIQAVNSRVYITLPDNAPSTELKLFLLNGRTVLETPLNQKHSTFLTNHLGAGIYLYQISSGDISIQSGDIIIK